jgi:hypothetical protein
MDGQEVPERVGLADVGLRAPELKRPHDIALLVVGPEKAVFLPERHLAQGACRLPADHDPVAPGVQPPDGRHVELVGPDGSG